MNGSGEFLLNTPSTICFLVNGIQLSLNVHVNTISTSRSYHVHQGKRHSFLHSSLLSVSAMYSVVLKSQEAATLKVSFSQQRQVTHLPANVLLFPVSLFPHLAEKLVTLTKQTHLQLIWHFSTNMMIQFSGPDQDSES